MLRDPAAVLAACRQLMEAIAKTRTQKERGRLEKRLQKAMSKAFRAQGKAFLAKFKALEDKFPTETEEARRLTEAVRNEDWEGLFDEAADDEIELFTGPIDSETTRAVLRGAKTVIAEAGAGIGFDLKNPRAEAFLEGRAAERVTGINDTTRDYLRTVITQGVKEGWSYEKVAQAITDRYEEFAVGKPQDHIDSRAHLIAITEIGDAYTAGQMAAGRELADAGIDMEKAWSDSGDEKVTDGCRENADAGWIPLDDPFPSGDDRPLRFPGCRCDMLIRAKGADE
jgi:uncharacterized protein with gpF-like domain